MTSTFDLQHAMDAWRRDVDTALDAWLPAGGDGQLCDAMRDAVLQGGKRMRPVIALAACQAVSDNLELGMAPACAVELVHAYSLVHDDLPAMDNDVERRGLPTVHVKYGEDIAILAGDGLLTLAFEVLADGAARGSHNLARAVKLLAHHAGHAGMVGGQASDLALGQDVTDLARLESVHARKTGGLYAAAAAMGAACAGADEASIVALERYGLAFGIAFQHADDVLDGDQPTLRNVALQRVGALVDQCHSLVAPMGARAEPLRAIAQWVQDRAKQAAQGAQLA